MESVKKEKKRPSYEPTEYMYSSSRTRAKEASLIGKEKLSRLVEAASVPALTAIASELGYLPSGNVSGAERERYFQEYLKRELDDAEEMLARSPSGEGRAIVRLLRTPYDCSNVKAAIKCSIGGVSPESMLFDIGNLPAQKAIEGEKARDLSGAGYPEIICRAAEKARELYAESRDPRVIDFVLDKACYAEMSRLADESGIPFMKGYVARKADSANLLTALRIARIYSAGSARAESTLREALLSGGAIRQESLSELVSINDKKEITPLLRAAVSLAGEKDYVRLSDRLSAEAPISETEQLLDDFVMEYVREGGRAPFGAELTAAYLIALESSVKNLRMIFAGKEAGLDSAVIRERMRLCYV